MFESRHSRPVRQLPRDPFFDQPYEAPSTDAAPSWEATVKPPSGARSISANIKPKRKVAALFSADAAPKVPVTVPATGPAALPTQPAQTGSDGLTD